MKFEIKNFKAVRGHDGQGFQCTLYVDGVRTAFIFDDGWGGGYQYDVVSQPHMKKMEDHIKTLPAVESYGMMLNIDNDIFVGELIDEHETKKQISKWCKTQTLFRLPGDEEGSWRTISHPYCQKVKDHIVKKYGKVEIANESL